MAISGSQAPAAIVGAGLGAGAGQSYLEVTQRLVNTVAWGQADGSGGRGGWQYGLDNNTSDGSAIGWNVLGILDAGAFGATIPSLAAGTLDLAGELEIEIASLTNADGSMGYTVASQLPNTPKTGVRLQALSLIGVPLGGTTAVTTVTPQTSVNYLDAGWNTPGNCTWGGAGPGWTNKGCLYAMFNVFKGLKLYGVDTLSNVPRADLDWHKDYQTYLVGTQSSPTSVSGYDGDDAGSQ